MRFRAIAFVVLLLLTPAALVAAAPGPDSILQYGSEPTLPLPKTLLFSVNADRILNDAPAWKELGVNGFFLEGVMDEWSGDVWDADGKPHTIGTSDETFQKVSRVTELCDTLDLEVFVKTVYANPLEWFNDTAWQHIYHKFRQTAIFARDSGCKGIAIDIEYVGQQFAFDWEGYDYKNYTRHDLVRVIRERSTEMLRAMYAEFPGMVFLILPEESFTLGTHIEAAWIEEAARQQAPGGVHLFMESTYTSENIRRTFASAAADIALFQRVLTPEAQVYWREHCTLASGVWPTGFDVVKHSNPEALPGELRECWAGSLMLSPRYNWIYADRYAEQHLGRALDKFPGAMDFAVCAGILREKKLVTNPEFVAVAQKLRTLTPVDMEGALGMVAMPRFMFPLAVPMLELAPSGQNRPEETARQWRIALEYYNGVEQNLQALYGPVREWQIIGPFPSPAPFTGHATVFQPESGVDLQAEYDGMDRKVMWQHYQVPEGGLGIDFKTLFTPTENVTAYAACWVESDAERQVQARFSTNDAGKLWIGGQLLQDFDRESWSILDRDILPVTLPKGRTQILAKVTNGIGAWSLVLRFTDEAGNPIPELRVGAKP